MGKWQILYLRTRYRSKLGWFFWLGPIHMTIRRNLDHGTHGWTKRAQYIWKVNAVNGTSMLDKNRARLNTITTSLLFAAMATCFILQTHNQVVKFFAREVRCSMVPWCILQTTERAKKVCPGLRDSASDCRGEFTPPRTNFFWPSLYVNNELSIGVSGCHKLYSNRDYISHDYNLSRKRNQNSFSRK